MVYSTNTHNQANFVGISLIKFYLNRIEMWKIEQNFITPTLKYDFHPAYFHDTPVERHYVEIFYASFHQDTAKNMGSRSRNSHMSVRNMT